jgi:hypothetical protein
MRIHISIPVLCIEYVQECDQLIHTYIGNDPHTFYINPDVSWNNLEQTCSQISSTKIFTTKSDVSAMQAFVSYIQSDQEQ